jgi:hypothetical protein
VWISICQSILVALGSGLLVAILGGLAVRRRLGQCYSFDLYLVAVLVPQVLEGIWPERFYVRDVWLVKEAVHHVLKVAIVLELTARTVSVFPGARRTAQTLLLGTLLLVLVVLTTAAVELEYVSIYTDLLPRVVSGVVWLFCALGFLILWYRLPVTRLHKAILLGFAVYLPLYSASMALTGYLGWHVRAAANLVSGGLYTALQAFWTWAAWRRQPAQEPARV